VDVTDLPYAGMVDGMVSTHKRLLEIHRGNTPPTERKAEVQ